jgi:hypothetical protein
MFGSDGPSFVPCIHYLKSLGLIIIDYFVKMKEKRKKEKKKKRKKEKKKERKKKKEKRKKKKEKKEKRKEGKVLKKYFIKL